jgi:hypothetical protein
MLIFSLFILKQVLKGEWEKSGNFWSVSEEEDGFQFIGEEEDGFQFIGVYGNQKTSVITVLEEELADHVCLPEVATFLPAYNEYTEGFL